MGDSRFLFFCVISGRIRKVLLRSRSQAFCGCKASRRRYLTPRGVFSEISEVFKWEGPVTLTISRFAPSIFLDPIDP